MSLSSRNWGSIFEEKRQEAFKKHLVVNLLKLIRVMQKIVII